MTQNLSRPAQILQDLIRCPSVTPHEGGALDYLQKRLEAIGFKCQRWVFKDNDTPDIDNLYARLGSKAPNLCFAGHTDVVPTGSQDAWSSGPFEGEILDDYMIGRGAVDMKGGIACFVAAVEELLDEGQVFDGSISFLITGDEEGPAINGTVKMLQHAQELGEKIDACIVGEPSNPEAIGDAIKVGRRGSLSGTLTVNGKQGHVAYPHLADNPIPHLLKLCAALHDEPLDQGSDVFQPSNLEFTSVDVGNAATNVIAQSASAKFNIRFNDQWNVETLQRELISRLDPVGAPYEIEWGLGPSESFLTLDARLETAILDAIKDVTGKQAERSTGGGTSDARFITNYAPVVEFGLVGQTMHQIDERVALADLETLTKIYRKFITKWFDS